MYQQNSKYINFKMHHFREKTVIVEVEKEIAKDHDLNRHSHILDWRDNQMRIEALAIESNCLHTSWNTVAFTLQEHKCIKNSHYRAQFGE